LSATIFCSVVPSTSHEFWPGGKPGSDVDPELSFDVDALLGKRAAELDPFDRVQLAEVIRVCRGSRSLSEAGRKLFAKSREQKKLVNDADRLRKYLARFELTFPDLAAQA
jgi:transcriptional regulatory protein RtcR